MSEPLLLTVADAAASLAVCQKTLWRMTRDGKLPCVRIGRAVRYSVDDLKACIAARRMLVEIQAPATISA